MVTGKKLIEALSLCEYKFKFTKYNWINDYLPGYFDIGFTIYISGNAFYGRGTASNENLAIIKSVMEALERCACWQHKIRTSGVAAHFNLNDAKINAHDEILERDLALCHFLTLTPMHLFNLNDPLVEKAVNIFKLQNINFKILRMKQTNNLIATIVIATGEKAIKPFGMVVGLGSKCDTESSLRSAFIECARNIAFVLNSTNLNSNNDLVSIHLNDNPKTHFHYALHKETPVKNSWLLENTSSSNIIASSETISGFTYEQLDTSFLKLNLENFFVIRAINTNLQNMYYGQTTQEKINFTRLSEFSGENINFEKINKSPHFFG